MALADEIQEALRQQREYKKQAQELTKLVKASRRREKKLKKKCAGLSVSDLRAILQDRVLAAAAAATAAEPTAEPH